MKTAVFISGPYSDKPEANVKEAIKVANKLIDAGFLPLIPHLWHYIEKSNPKEYDVWLNLSLELLQRADCYLRFGGESKGADAEEKLAFELDVPIFHSFEDLLEALPDGNI
jgi:hypothetical protein